MVQLMQEQEFMVISIVNGSEILCPCPRSAPTAKLPIENRGVYDTEEEAIRAAKSMPGTIVVRCVIPEPPKREIGVAYTSEDLQRIVLQYKNKNKF